MDTTEFVEGKYITAAYVKNSPTKMCIVLDEGHKDTKFNQLTLLVDIDQKQKEWSLNTDSVKNMQQLGMDSKFWVGNRVRLSVVTIGGKERVIGTPIPTN